MLSKEQRETILAALAKSKAWTKVNKDYKTKPFNPHSLLPPLIVVPTFNPSKKDRSTKTRKDLLNRTNKISDQLMKKQINKIKSKKDPKLLKQLQKLAK